MAHAKCLVVIDGKLIVTSQQTGKRYVFTRRTRTLEIDDCDIEQFDAKVIHVSSKGCCGGKGTQDKTVKVFEIIQEECNASK